MTTITIGAPSIARIPTGPPGPGSDGDASTVVTALASEVGSHVGDGPDAFLRSITFYKDKPADLVWQLTLCDPKVASTSRILMKKRSNRSQRLRVESIGGCVSLSLIQPGDFLKSINGKRIGLSHNAKRAMEMMDHLLEKDGVLSVAVGNEDGKDVLVQATVIKPRPDMTHKDMGIKAWYWGALCIHKIDSNGIFAHTVLKEDDHIISINDIVCDKMKGEEFHHVIDCLPNEVTIVVKRGRQRWTGRFG